MSGPLSHTCELQQRQPFILLCLSFSPLLLKRLHDHNEHKFGGKNQLWKALPTMMIRLLSHFLILQLEHKMAFKKIAVKKKRQKVESVQCYRYNKTFTRVTVFFTIILCRNVHVFYHRTTAKGSEKKHKTKQNKVLFIRYISSHHQAGLLHNVQQENVFKGKHDHIFCSKSSIIKESFVRKSCVKYILVWTSKTDHTKNF